jgi:hypothetical protein
MLRVILLDNLVVENSGLADNGSGLWRKIFYLAIANNTFY